MPLIPMPDRVVLADMPLEPDPHWWRQWTVQPGDHTRSHTEILGPGAPVALAEMSPQTALLLERATVLSLPAADTNALIQLRDYQRECVAAVADAWWKRNVQRPLIVLPCAAGKTIIAAELIRIFHQQSLGERVLFLAHRKVLLDQTAEKLRLVSPATRVGVVQAKNNELGREVTVASIQTLGHRSRKRLQQLLDHGPYGLIILDECFPAGTLVGDRPIETLRAGDLVPSFDETTGALCSGRVAAVMRRPSPTTMYVVRSGGRSVVTTANHPFWTRTGWKPAALLSTHDEVLLADQSIFLSSMRRSSGSDASAGGLLFDMQTASARGAVIGQRVDRNLPDLSGHHNRRRPRSLAEPEPRIRLLLDPVFEGPVASGLFRDDVTHQSQVRIRSNEDQQPYARSRSQEPNGRHVTLDWSSPSNPWRQWPGPDGSGTNTVPRPTGDRSRLDHQLGGADETRTWLGLPQQLQDRHCSSGSSDRDRDRRWLSRSDGATGSGPEEDGALTWTRVDSVSLLESRCDDADGCVRDVHSFVYNIEVERTHTYVANGFVVHNCHHATSSTHETVLRALAEANPQRLLLGLTATPGRADGTALDTVFDEIVFERNLFDMISLGWLVPPRGFRVHLDVDLDQVESENGDFVTAQLSKVMNTPQVNTAVVHAWMRYGMDRKFLVFTVDVAHARDLAQEFRDAGYTAAVLTAGTKEKEREKIYAQFRAGEVKLLLSCEVLTEGYDEPSAEGVLFARPTQSQSFMIQAAGRGMRLFPGKTECIIIDVVGNTERHQLVQLATLAGFEPELPLEGDGEPERDEETGDSDDEPTVLSADIRGEEFSFHARQARTRYQWRETDVGWILQVPKIGYYLVAWSDRARQRATIRFYDQRKGRRDTIPREVCTQPIAFEIAYSMVEAEMDRIFNARSNRRNDKNEEVEDAPDISFVDLDDGLEEATEIPEEWVLRGAEWRDQRITERQRSLLTKLSAKRTTMPETAGEASDLIVILQVEWDVKWREPATPKQLAYIHVNGLDYKPGMTKKAAARQIWKHRKASGR